MLVKTSNFRISLDLFELATSGTNYGLQTAFKAFIGCTKVALWYFDSFPAKCCLKMNDTLIFFLVRNLLSKMPQAQMSHGLRSGVFGGHYAVEMKRRTSFLWHSWLMRAKCEGAESCCNLHDLFLPMNMRMLYFRCLFCSKSKLNCHE